MFAKLSKKYNFFLHTQSTNLSPSLSLNKFPSKGGRISDTKKEHGFLFENMELKKSFKNNVL